MTDFAIARRNMVDCQLRPAAITHSRLLAILASLPRENFLSKQNRANAYGEAPILIAPGRYMLGPLSVAVLLQEAEIRPSDVVLVAGAGDGYMVAVTARLADTVIGLESDSALAARAAEQLNEAGIDNIALVSGALTAGYPKQAPYDVIVLNGAVEQGIEPLLAQLKDGGRLVCVEYIQGIGRARLYRRDGGVTAGRTVRDLAAPLLPGFERAVSFHFD